MQRLVSSRVWPNLNEQKMNTIPCMPSFSKPLNFIYLLFIYILDMQGEILKHSVKHSFNNLIKALPAIP